MGRTSRWFRTLFGLNHRRHHHHQKPVISDDGGGPDAYMAYESNKHAVAVAAATAAVAEAALAAAKAAAEVVRLTAATPAPVAVPELYISRRWSVEEFAAIKIQAAFRGYLARRALKALKGLVKLQALVRGHLVRKQSAAMLRRLQTLVRVQGQARSNRTLTSDSVRENSNRYELQMRSTLNSEDASALKRCISASSIRSDTRTARTNQQLAQNWLDNWVEAGGSSMRILRQNDDEKYDKILEIDTWEPNSNPKSHQTTPQNYHNNPNNTQKQGPNWDTTSFRSSVGYPPDEGYSTDQVKGGYGRKSPRDATSFKSSVGYPPDGGYSTDQVKGGYGRKSFMDATSFKSSGGYPPDGGYPTDQVKGGYGRKSPRDATSFKSSDGYPPDGGYPSEGGYGRKSPMTPMRDEFYSGRFYQSPSYMGYTESSRAKSRSQSVPRLRGGESEKRGGFSKRSLQGFWDRRKSLDPFSNSSK